MHALMYHDNLVNTMKNYIHDSRVRAGSLVSFFLSSQLLFPEPRGMICAFQRLPVEAWDR